MSLGRPEPLDFRSELIVRDGGRELRFPLTEVSPELREWLAGKGQEGYVFVASHKPGKKAKVRKKLPDAFQEGAEGEEHLTAELHSSGEEPLSGWFVPGASQRRGRELARALGVHTFVWGKADAPGEVHRTASLGDDFYEADDDRWFGAARSGREDFLHSVADLLEEPRRWLAILGGRVQGLWLLIVALAGIGLGGYGWLAVTRTEPSLERADREDASRSGGELGDRQEPEPDAKRAEEDAEGDIEEDDDDPPEWEYHGPQLDGVVKWILHPALLPALALGLLLRRRRPAPRGDLTASEAEEAWRTFAPTLASAWFYCAAGVLVLSLARAIALDSLGLDSLEAFGKRLVICLWVLPAVAWSRASGDLLGRCFSAFYAAVFAIFGLKLFLLFAGMINRILWQSVGMFVPDLPELFQVIGDVVANLGAEGFFLMVMLSYTWAMQREQFARWNAGD